MRKFKRGEILALSGQEGLVLCQCCQNMNSDSTNVKVKWLKPVLNGPENVFKVSFIGTLKDLSHIIDAVKMMDKGGLFHLDKTECKRLKDLQPDQSKVREKKTKNGDGAKEGQKRNNGKARNDTKKVMISKPTKKLLIPKRAKKSNMKNRLKNLTIINSINSDIISEVMKKSEDKGEVNNNKDCYLPNCQVDVIDEFMFFSFNSLEDLEEFEESSMCKSSTVKSTFVPSVPQPQPPELSSKSPVEPTFSTPPPPILTPPSFITTGFSSTQLANSSPPVYSTLFPHVAGVNSSVSPPVPTVSSTLLPQVPDVVSDTTPPVPTVSLTPPPSVPDVSLTPPPPIPDVIHTPVPPALSVFLTPPPSVQDVISTPMPPALTVFPTPPPPVPDVSPTLPPPVPDVVHTPVPPAMSVFLTPPPSVQDVISTLVPPALTVFSTPPPPVPDVSPTPPPSLPDVVHTPLPPALTVFLTPPPSVQDVIPTPVPPVLTIFPTPPPPVPDIIRTPVPMAPSQLVETVIPRLKAVPPTSSVHSFQPTVHSMSLTLLPSVPLVPSTPPVLSLSLTPIAPALSSSSASSIGKSSSGIDCNALTSSPKRSSEGDEVEQETTEDDEEVQSFRSVHFVKNVKKSYKRLREKNMFSDVTISCEKCEVEAHKLILASSSHFFSRLLQRNSFRNNPHPIIILKDIKMKHLRFILDFMYTGELNVPENDIAAVLQAGEALEVKGLKYHNPSDSETKKRKVDQFSTSSCKSFPTKRSHSIG